MQKSKASFSRRRVAINKMADFSGFSEADARQFLESDLAEGFGDMSPADVALAMDDRGWVRMGQQLDGDVPWNVRKLTILRSRMYWLMDGHAQSAVRTWTDYTLGSGMGFKADDDATQKILSDFWNSRYNRNVTSAEGQRRLNRRLLVDGELFFAIFNTDKGVVVRKVDCTQVTQIITNPEDSEEVWAYRRTFGTPDGRTTTIFYRDWRYPDADLSDINITAEGYGDSVVPEENVVMYHLPFNAIHQRGNSLFSSALPWMQALRQFMEDRLAITQGLAKFIRKVTVKGGQAQLAKIQAAMTQAVTQTGTPTGNAALDRARKTAQTLFANDAVEMGDVPRTTGASDSRQDYRNIRLMICGGVGITEPYFGDAEAGNLASVTAMELPMLKQFESHQQLWADCWRDIFSIVANFEDPQPVEVAVDWPPIVKENVQQFITALTTACTTFPELKQPEVLAVALGALNINNVDKVLAEVLKAQETMQAEAKANAAKGLDPSGKPYYPPNDPNQGNKTSAASASEAVEPVDVTGLLVQQTAALLEAVRATE